MTSFTSCAMTTDGRGSWASGKMRQLEGIAAAKVKGVYTGRKPSIAADQVRRLAANGMGGTAIARELKISRASVYRLLNGGEG